ncbi:MAG: glycosyltransferase [Bacteroidetes bacterium]|nr:glycosyltransferase [Bacteroidota bacterium]
MQLSVIIVNYNVKYFLEHCLLSVFRAASGLSCEIFVVDNNSSDESVEMVKAKFPSVILIENWQNAGFARANNQAVDKAKGKYILYLNPDTIVPEDCFTKCLAYMEAHEEVGALGCRLIDGKGEFLPESKRGFPSADVAFYKITGLSGLFKKSKYFNRYHVGYLPEFEVNEVDVLAGCFMWCRKTVIDKVGSFDTDYFMYGEDIDLSYKIKKAGFKNVYFPETSIIHYKGESTKKGSLNYVKMFYQAMIIFAKKHLRSSKKGLFIVLIQVAIYIRAILAMFINLFGIIRLPLLDAILVFASLIATKNFWISNIKTETHYPASVLSTFFILYAGIWITSVYFNGGYDKPYRASRIMRGMLIGGILSIALYGLLPEQYRFSRGITVLGALLATLLILLSRKLMIWLKLNGIESEDRSKQVMIVGSPEEENEIRRLLNQAHIEKKIAGSLSPFENKENYQLGIFSNIKPLSKLYQCAEIIFVQGTLSFKQIIDSIQDIGTHIEYKIHGYGTDSIIGSNSKNTAGDLYTTEIVYGITSAASRRNKRSIDMLCACCFLLLSPILIWFAKNKSTYFLHHVLVLEGDMTYIGYSDPQFPALKPHLLSVLPPMHGFEIPADNEEHLNWLYAKNYSAWHDVKLIWMKWRGI